MAGRGRAALTGKDRRMTSRSASDPSAGALPREPLVYTAQDVAHFCEVDLKTIHHWANANKIAHRRTEGRHIRIRRNDLVKFLLAHGYPLHDAITSVKPMLFVAGGGLAELGSDEIAKKLSARFHLRRFDHAATAIAHLVHDEPDALVCSLDDPSWNTTSTIAALKSDPNTAWPVIAVVTQPDVAPDATLGADLVMSIGDIARLHTELAKHLAVS
jgi:excisionase family DNA binding protein